MSTLDRCLYRVVVLGACATLSFAAATAGSFEDAVRARWRGAWVVVTTDVYSSCNGAASYHTNTLSGTLVTNRGGNRFVGGELGKVQKLQLKKKRVDLMITLDEPLLVSRQDGPFTLYDERHCAVSLEIMLPREMTKTRNVEGIDALVSEIVERFDTREAALDSAAWNGRERDPFPADYNLTLARHAAWKVEQVNLAVDRKKGVAFEQVKSTGKAIADDPDYLAGLGAGTVAMRRWDPDDCNELMGREFGSIRRGVPDDHRGDTEQEERWRQGYEDGQRLVYSILLLERLDGCYVPAPPGPGETSQGS